eukprot:CFRG3773T1
MPKALDQHDVATLHFHRDEQGSLGFGLGIFKSSFLLVSAVRQSAPCAKAGLKMGDEVLTWDGVDVSGVDPWDVLQDIQNDQTGERKHIMVIRRRPFCRNVNIYFSELISSGKVSHVELSPPTLLMHSTRAPDNRETFTHTGSERIMSAEESPTNITESIHSPGSIPPTPTPSPTPIPKPATLTAFPNRNFSDTDSSHLKPYRGLMVAPVALDSKSTSIARKMSVFVSVHRRISICYFSCFHSGESRYEDCGVVVQNGVLVCKEANVAILELNGKKMVGIPDKKIESLIYRQAMLQEQGLAAKVRAVVIDEEIFKCLFPSPSAALFLRRYENS